MTDVRVTVDVRDAEWLLWASNLGLEKYREDQGHRRHPAFAVFRRFESALERLKSVNGDLDAEPHVDVYRTVAEVARASGCSPRRIRQLCERGDFIAHKTNARGDWAIFGPCADDWIARRKGSAYRIGQ